MSASSRIAPLAIPIIILEDDRSKGRTKNAVSTAFFTLSFLQRTIRTTAFFEWPFDIRLPSLFQRFQPQHGHWPPRLGTLSDQVTRPVAQFWIENRGRQQTSSPKEVHEAQFCDHRERKHLQ